MISRPSSSNANIIRDLANCANHATSGEFISAVGGTLSAISFFAFFTVVFANADDRKKPNDYYFLLSMLFGIFMIGMMGYVWGPHIGAREAYLDVYTKWYDDSLLATTNNAEDVKLPQDENLDQSIVDHTDPNTEVYDIEEYLDDIEQQKKMKK